MKVIIEKQTDKLGDEYLEQEEVAADITLIDNTFGQRRDRNLIIEVDKALYIIPFAIIKGLEIMNEIPSDM